MVESRDDRNPIVIAYDWVARITTISLEMVLPAVGGHWLDTRWGTGGLFLILGAVLGFATALWSLLQLTRPPRRRPPAEDQETK
jgi:hypothetical protein